MCWEADATMNFLQKKKCKINLYRILFLCYYNQVKTTNTQNLDTPTGS